MLPLGPTEEEATGFTNPHMSSWPTIPFACDIPLQKRWDCFKAVISSRTIKLVTYNATVSLLPLYNHLIHDRSKRDSVSFNECMANLLDTSTNDGKVFRPLAPDECLYSIWDLRLVSWMLQPNASDAQLEYSYMKEGFAQLRPDLQDPNHEDFATLTSGLVEAMNNLALIEKIYPRIDNRLIENNLTQALEEIEAPVQSILASMECRGIGFNPKRLKNAQTSIEAAVQRLEEQSRKITKDKDFLLSSPKQVSEFIFDVLKITMPAGLVSKTKAGSNHRSTSEETLRAIKAEMLERDGKVHPIIDVVLDFRRCNKMLTTYVVPLPMFGYKELDGDPVPKIHPQWMQTVREL